MSNGKITNLAAEVLFQASSLLVGQAAAGSGASHRRERADCRWERGKPPQRVGRPALGMGRLPLGAGRPPQSTKCASAV